MEIAAWAFNRRLGQERVRTDQEQGQTEDCVKDTHTAVTRSCSREPPVSLEQRETTEGRESLRDQLGPAHDQSGHSAEKSCWHIN